MIHKNVLLLDVQCILITEAKTFDRTGNQTRYSTTACIIPLHYAVVAGFPGSISGAVQNFALSQPRFKIMTSGPINAPISAHFHPFTKIGFWEDSAKLPEILPVPRFFRESGLTRIRPAQTTTMKRSRKVREYLTRCFHNPRYFVRDISVNCPHLVRSGPGRNITRMARTRKLPGISFLCSLYSSRVSRA